MGILFNARDYAVIDHLVWQGRKKRIFDRLKAETVQRVGSYLAMNDRPPQEICEVHVEITPRRNQHQPTVWSMRSSVARRGDGWEITVEYFGPYDRTPFAEISIGSLLHSPKLLQEFYVTSWRGKTFHIEPVPGWDDSTPTNRNIVAAESWRRHSSPIVGFASAHADKRRQRDAVSIDIPSPDALSRSGRMPIIETPPSGKSYSTSDGTYFEVAGAPLCAEFLRSIDTLPVSIIVKTPPARLLHSAKSKKENEIERPGVRNFIRPTRARLKFANLLTPRTRQRTLGDHPNGAL